MKRLLFSILLSFSLIFAGCVASNKDVSSGERTLTSLATSSSAINPTEEKGQNTLPADSTSPTTEAAAKLLKVHYIDVGQGDSIFIELPDKRSVLIDAGESDTSNTIISTIKAAKEDTLDYVVATHPHSDHIGGMNAVLKSFQVKSVYMPKVSHTTKTYETLLTTIQNMGLKVNTAKAGVTILSADNVTINVLAPVKDKYADLNDWSAVIKLTYGSTSFLFAGDATEVSEQEITGNLKTDVLKVGHHGSRYSTTDSFLSKASPKYAVISVGKDNSYGHPMAETLNKLKKANISVYRTDLSGTITFTSDGSKISVDKTPNAGSAATTTRKQTTVKQTTTTTTKAAVQSVYVYVTQTGSKYHLEGCTYLSQSRIKMTLAEAKKEHSPCSKCNPPQ